jgi:hypothetical protein
MFQNIGVFQKIFDLDISKTCDGEKTQVYKNKYIYIYIYIFFFFTYS